MLILPLLVTILVVTLLTVSSGVKHKNVEGWQLLKLLKAQKWQPKKVAPVQYRLPTKLSLEETSIKPSNPCTQMEYHESNSTML